jgi:hypothetical protein
MYSHLHTYFTAALFKRQNYMKLGENKKIKFLLPFWEMFTRLLRATQFATTVTDIIVSLWKNTRQGEEK